MKKKSKDYDIIIDGKKMKRVRIRSLANRLLPYYPYETEDGTRIYRLLYYYKKDFHYAIIYKKNGRFYIESR